MRQWFEGLQRIARSRFVALPMLAACTWASGELFGFWQAFPFDQLVLAGELLWQTGGTHAPAWGVIGLSAFFLAALLFFIQAVADFGRYAASD